MTSAPVGMVRLGWALDIALVAVAAVVIFAPDARNPGLKDAVLTLWMLQGGLAIYSDWKAGYLTKTFGEVYRTIRVAGPPRRRRFEHLAFFMGLIASVVASWS